MAEQFSNFHTHTILCDGKDEPEALVQEALRLGCPALGFSGHSYAPYDRAYCMSPEETEEYKAVIHRLRKKYAGRIRLLHLKDYRIGEMKMPEGGIDFTNRESIMKFMGGFNNVVQFAEVGEGTLPVAACIEAGLAGGSEYFLVEQDDTYGRDPFESLKISHDNLVKLGYGEWF